MKSVGISFMRTTVSEDFRLNPTSWSVNKTYSSSKGKCREIFSPLNQKEKLKKIISLFTIETEELVKS